MIIEVDWVLKLQCREGSKVQCWWANSEPDSGGVWQPSQIHGGSPQQLCYVPSYWCSYQMWKLFPGSGQSEAVQGFRPWQLCRQCWVAIATLAKILLQLFPSEVSHVPINLVLPVWIELEPATTAHLSYSSVYFLILSSLLSFRICISPEFLNLKDNYRMETLQRSKDNIQETVQHCI